MNLSALVVRIFQELVAESEEKEEEVFVL